MLSDENVCDVCHEVMHGGHRACVEKSNEAAEDLAVEAIGHALARLTPDIAGTCAAMCLERLTGVPTREVLDYVNARERQRKGEDMTPTGPGVYWWRPSPECQWSAVVVGHAGTGRLRVKTWAWDGWTPLRSLVGMWGGLCLGMPSP